MTKQYKDAYVDRAEGADEYSTALRGGDVIVAFVRPFCYSVNFT